MRRFTILHLQILAFIALSKSYSKELQGTLGNKNILSSSLERHNNKVEEQTCGKGAQKDKISEKSPAKDQILSMSLHLTLAEKKEHNSPVESTPTRIIREKNLITHNPRLYHTSSKKDQQRSAFPGYSIKMLKNYEDAEAIEEWAHPTFKKGKETKEGVWILQKDGDLEAFTNKAPVVIVYFYRYSGSTALLRFLREYKKSAQELLRYKVLLAIVECGEYQVASYCESDKINRFAYGFRGGQEKIAFPLDTLYNNNAIVASALHLALINTVPILQTAGERRNLENRCRGQCDLIFAYLRTLGTNEHRAFLEMAHAYQSSFVFAITTYSAGILGLPQFSHSEQEDQEKGMWVIHCRDKAVNKDCVVSNYYGKMVLPQLLHFIHILLLPLWHEISVIPVSQKIVTPYDQVDLPWVLLLHDDSSAGRVKILAPSLAQFLHGSVAVITVNMEGVGGELLSNLGLNYHSITTPALAFIQRNQRSTTTLLNDYDDTLEWVKEQLLAMHLKEPQSKEEQGYLPVQVVEELQQDDEVVLGAATANFCGVVQLAGSTPYYDIFKNKKMNVIAFYLTWDPASSALLQHLNAVAPLLEEHNSQASLYSINCFDWPLLCDSQGISTYPVLSLHPYGRRSVIYDGPINYRHILRTILLMEQVSPVELTNVKAMEDMMVLKKEIHPASWFTNAAVVGVFSKEEDASTFREVCQVLEGTQLFGLYVSQDAVSTYCASKKGCVVVSKPRDIFQPWTTIEAPLLKSPMIKNILAHSTLNVMDQLDPERYTAIHITEDLKVSSSQHLIIVFLPNPNSQPLEDMPQSFPSRRNEKPQDDLFTTIGHLASEMSEPGFTFSWLTWDDPLAQQLSTKYGLSQESQALIAIEVKEGAVHIFPPSNSTRASLQAWLTGVREGHHMPSVLLPRRMWGPRLPGFDFLKFMQEDLDQYAEDHLVLEMEADLTTKVHEGDGSTKKKILHEEL